MITEIRALLASWSPPIGISVTVAVVAAIYARGWFAIRATRPKYFTGWRLTSFLLGMLVLWLSIGSPIDAFADVLLSAHMVQHLLLMSVVPPLIVLGAPIVPLLRGLPRWTVKSVLRPFFVWTLLRRVERFLIAPIVAWLAMNLVFVIWHVPAAYDYALLHENWHNFEHICFLASSLMFWWVIIHPWPSHGRSSSWMMVLYLMSADIVNTALAAFLAFCDKPAYSFYVTGPNPFHVSALSDQVLGAVIMWVLGSFVFLVPAILITFQLLAPERTNILAPQDASRGVSSA
ncbi:MAG: cytochrome c oxidase assembly protein [Candidatus Acidiferrales bacterium]